MPAVPAQRTWADNDALSTTNLNSYLSDSIKFLLNPPIAELRQTAAQSLTSGTWTAITFGVEDVDDDPDGTGAHSTSSNTSRYTARYPGWYLCCGGVGFASNATNVRGTRWAVNGTALNGAATVEAAANATAQYAARGKHVFLNEGDYVELQGFQNSGGALNTAVSADQQPNASIKWVSN